MVDPIVTCPKCGHKFPLGDVMRHGIEEELRREFDKKYTSKQRALDREFGEKADELKLREKALSDLKDSIDKEVAKKLEAQREALAKKTQDQAREDVGKEFKENEQALKVAEKRLKEARDRESEVLRLKAALDDRERELDLKVDREFDQKRKELEERVRLQESERWEIQLRGKDEELARVNKALDQAQRAGASGELLGEVAEQTLEDRLSAAFPDDSLEAVGRGKRGGDLLQTVQGGGSILWESKDGYSAWSNEWIAKLKKDRDDSKASVAILVTKIGPGSKPVLVPKLEDEVVLVPPGFTVGVSSLLRPQLAEIARQRRLYERQGTIQAAVYAWVTSQEFQRGVAAVVESVQRLEARVKGAQRAHAKWFRHMADDVDQTMAAIGDFYGSAQSRARLPNLSVFALNPDEVESDEPSAGEGD